MIEIRGNVKLAEAFTNKNTNNKTAEETSKNLNKSTTLSVNSQGDILSGFIKDFDGFNSAKGQNDVDYFWRQNENNTTECLRVIEEDGQNKVIYTTIDSNTGIGETKVYDLSRADNFDIWTVNDTNYEKVVDGNGVSIEEFEMFDFDAPNYSKDLKEFAQEYINKYDSNNDGNWNYDEFTNMSTGGYGIDQEDTALYEELFNNLNLDDDKQSVSAEEFASFLYVADLDLDKYIETGEVASSLDGKVNYLNYQFLPDPSLNMIDWVQSEKQSFYDNFYVA